MIDFISIKQLFFSFFVALVLFIKAMIPFIMAAGTSLYLVLSAYTVGIIGGSIFGLMLASSYRFIWLFAFTCTGIIRNTPLLIHILFFYYGLPHFGVHYGPLKASMIALMFNSSAYIAHIIYKGIVAIPKGQLETAHALGFSFFKTKIYIVLPQAFLTMASELSNHCITLIKQTSLASVIGVWEITTEATHIFCTTYNAATPLLMAGLTYLILIGLFNILLSQLQLYYNVSR